MNRQTIAIFGATSAIAKAYARLKCDSSIDFVLVARDQDMLTEIKNDLLTRGAGNIETLPYDFENIKGLSGLVSSLAQKHIDIALIAYGTLPDQKNCQNSLEYAEKHYSLNATSILLLLSLLSKKFKEQQSGTIAVITSVAGDRGKKSNHYYGAAKASVSVFLQGLRQDLFKNGVHVVDIKPGFVDTPMTASFDKGFLWAKPDQISSGIDRAIRCKKNIVYLPWFWKWIMCIIRAIPESIFKKLEM